MKQTYQSPETKVIFTKVRHPLCQSINGRADDYFNDGTAGDEIKSDDIIHGGSF